jgi:hypothetical protein
MKILIAFILSFLSSITCATTWYDLQFDDEVVNFDSLNINEEVQLIYPSKSTFYIKDIIQLPINVVVYKLSAKICNHAVEQEMILMNAPSYNNREVIVGVTHNSICEIEIYIENSDLFAESFFEKANQ